MPKPGFAYIMTNYRNGTLYIGVTSDLPKRAYQHRNKLIEGFSNRHGCTRLVWYAAFDDIELAREKERQMKKWKRSWKLRAIEEMNPDWDDLFDTLF